MVARAASYKLHTCRGRWSWHSWRRRRCDLEADNVSSTKSRRRFWRRLSKPEHAEWHWCARRGVSIPHSKRRAFTPHNVIHPRVQRPVAYSIVYRSVESIETLRRDVRSTIPLEEDGAMSTSNAQIGSHEWKPEDIKCTVGAPVKPRRPYTPYNLFYLLERERVVQKNEPAMALEKKVKSEQIRKTRPLDMQNRKEDKIPMPKRYDNVLMLPQWYDPNLKEKRKHRKSNGKVSRQYAALSLLRLVLEGWTTYAPCRTPGLLQRADWSNFQELGRH